MWALIMKAKTGTHLWSLAVLLGLGLAVNVHSQTDTLSRAETTVRELSGLTIVDCVRVLSFKTDYQVNLELRDYDYRQPQYRLDLVGLQEQPIEKVLSNLLSQTGDYVFVRTGRTINVLPRERWNTTNSVFNTVLRQYEVREQNLVGAFEPLYRGCPQVALVFPVSVGIDFTPDEIARHKADTRAGPAFSLSLHDASARNVLNEIARKSEDSFWIAQPSAEIPPKWHWISIFRRDYGKDVLYKHDPGLHEQFEKLMLKKKQEYEERHPND
jgi:hydrogenase maturation factor